jgi:4-amino-4-deoxy-L-arabinose transferase-like glycosyltransferase
LKKITENSWWAFAFLLVASAYFAGLFVDLTGDSGLYSAISRQMVDSGDWFNLKINDKPYDQKPHLFFWLAGLGIQLFGNTNFAFKLFPFIYGAAGIYFTYRLGKQLFSVEAGKWAALITGTSQIYFLYFFDFHTDSVLQTGVVLALWQLAAHIQHKKWPNFVFGFLGVGLAMLSKGPVGAVLPFFAVLLFLVSQKDFRQLFHPKWFLGIFISFMVISPTLIHLYNSFGVDGIKFFFITNNFGRITGEYAGSSTDYFFYFHTLLWAFLPWTVFVVFALVSEIKNWFNSKIRNIWVIYLLGSVFVLFLILSIAKGKAPNYFLIAVSPIAVITGKWIEEIIKSGKFSFKKLLLYTTVIAGSLNLYMNAIVIPGLFEYQGARQVLKLYETQGSPQTQLFNFEVEDYNLFFYARQPVENIDNWEDFYQIIKNRGNWIYTNEIKYNDIIKMNYDIDTVYQIRQKGMNRIDLEFLNPKTREHSLKSNYLIVPGSKNKE